ncbi:MAG: ricin-type beta-trefoil lectin domain protein [Micromonosporaceae bacterium]
MRRPDTLRRTATTLLAGAALAVAAVTPASAGVENPSTTSITPLPAELEAIRAQEATALYGSPEIRPISARKTSIASMGDSEISGEGQGPYETGTNGDDDGDGDENWCHRALHAGIHRTGIAVDQTYNLACSGATTQNLIYGSGVRQWDELNQGDYLAIKARNTNLKLIWIVASANDAGGIEFGPVMTDCTIRRVTFQGNCWPDYTNSVQARVTVSGDKLKTAIGSVKQTMTDAGYTSGAYQIVVMGYPSPVSPDVEDNPDFPGWYGGGCLLYLKDMAIGRNKVVPLFERAIRRAALDHGVRYLDNSRLFHGHEPCEQTPWVSGVTIAPNSDLTNPNTYRQSWHPNYRGHGAFGACMGAFYGIASQTGTCVDPQSTNGTRLIGGLLDFRQLRNAASRLCLDSQGYSTRNTYDLLQWSCHGGSNQGWWYDGALLHIELTHDRCADAEGGLAAGRMLIAYDCRGTANQRWTFDNGLIRNGSLCLGVADASAGTRVRLATCNGSDARQRWSWETQTGTTGFGYDDWIPSSAY